jgi:hypothetical protein
MSSVWIDYSGLRTRAMRFRTDCVLPIALFLMISITALVRGDDRPPATDSSTIREVKRLIGRLDADTRTERLKARDALLALGPAVLPFLPEDQTISSAAARQALHEIRLRLQHDWALASLAPSRVTLNGSFSLREILAQIAAQTGNQFDTTALEEARLARPLNVDFRSQSFWRACDGIVTKTGLEYGTVSQGRLQLVAASPGTAERTLAVADDGAFRVAVASASIRPSAVSRTRYALRIAWSLRAEPRLRPLFATISGRDLRAQSSDASVVPAPAALGSSSTASPPGGPPAGAVFRPISPAAKLEPSMDEGQEVLRLDADFEFPAGAAQPKIEFSGSFSVEMAAGPVRFVFKNLAAPGQPAQRAGAVAVRLRQVEFPANGKPGDARVEISVVYDQRGPAFESFRTWIYHNELWLEDKSGHPIRPRPLVAMRRQDDGGIAVEYNFADVTGTPADYRVVYVAPTLITRTPVQFQLPNIPTTRAGQQGAQP